MHQLLKPGAPFVGVGDEDFAGADFVGAAGCELVVGGKANSLCAIRNWHRGLVRILFPEMGKGAIEGARVEAVRTNH